LHFRTLVPNRDLSGPGGVAFGATVKYQDLLNPFGSVKENGVSLIADAGTHRLVWQGEDSGAGAPFFSFADPTIRDGSILVRAVLGTTSTGPKGFFVVDGSGLQPIAVEGADMGGMTFTALRGRALSDSAGDVIFPATLGND